MTWPSNGDGTFKCVVAGFSQLNIFHATVENILSLPVLFCLVKGKNEQTYVRLLEMVEELAREANLTILNRDVMFMCDFEQAMIKVIQQHYASFKVKCCFFHFTQNIPRRRRRPSTSRRNLGVRTLKGSGCR